MKHPDGRKWIRPFHFGTSENKYLMKEPDFPNGKLLYNLHEILIKPNDDIWVNEGELCCDKASSKLGILTTTSGGATSAQSANWKPVAGRNIFIFPDKNPEGITYSNDVKEILLSLGCTIKIIDIAKLDIPEKGDIVDWLNANPNAIKEDLYSLPMIEALPQVMPDHDWPDPEPIKNELIPVEILPSEIIPEPYRSFATDVAERMQCPIDYIAVSLLIVTATLVGAGVGIKPKKEDDWLVIPNLWACVVGRPGMMKTPATNEVLRFLDNLQDESKKNYDESLKDYNIELEIYKSRKEAIKSQIVNAEKNLIKNGAVSGCVSSEHLRNCLKELKEPEKPIWRRFKTNDSTVEKLNELLSENPRGLLVFRDEIMGWLRTFEKTGHETDRAFFLEAWNGNGSQTSDRIGRGTTHAENLCLSVFGTTQPDKLIRYLYGAIHGENDGLIQLHQLLVYPDEPKDWQRVDRKPNNNAHNMVASIIKNLADMNFVQRGATQENNEIPYFRFSDDAQQLFYEWWGELEIKLRCDEHPIVIEHLSKYRSLMPSFALLFHLIDVANNEGANMISKINAAKAAAWCEYLESHARRIYSLAIDCDMKAASLLAEKITKGKLQDGFTVRDVYRQNWSILNNKSIAQSACEELVEAGWLQEKTIEAKFGQRSKVIYLINPKIGDIKNG